MRAVNQFFGVQKDGVDCTEVVANNGKRMVLNIYLLDFLDAGVKYHQGATIQDAFPMLSDNEREFLLTGLTPEDWNRIFPPDEYDTDDDSEINFV